MVNNDYRMKRKEKDTENDKIKEKQEELDELHRKKNQLEQTIESQEGELKERATTIDDKNERINELRKKT